MKSIFWSWIESWDKEPASNWMTSLGQNHKLTNKQHEQSVPLCLVFVCMCDCVWVCLFVCLGEYIRGCMQRRHEARRAGYQFFGKQGVRVRYYMQHKQHNSLVLLLVCLKCLNKERAPIWPPSRQWKHLNYKPTKETTFERFKTLSGERRGIYPIRADWVWGAGVFESQALSSTVLFH